MDETYPPEWSDDQRMTVLFAAFRDKSLNPHSWNKKMQFWMEFITERCKNSNRCTINTEELASQFERKGKTPKCLDVVIQEMTRLKQIRKLSDIQPSQVGWVSWGINMVRKPLSWSLGLVSGNKSEAETQYYFPELLQEKCEKILKRHYDFVEYDSTDNLLELSVFKKRYRDVLGHDLNVVLRQLEADRKIAIAQTKEDDTIIKFCKQDQSTVEPIGETDLNIHRMKKVQEDLEKQIDSLSEKHDSYTEEARKFVKEGKKTKALQALRKRKSVEKSMERKSNSLDILHEMWIKIQEASTNNMIVKAYESGVSALKGVQKDVNIGKVDNVMDSIQQLLDDQEEINLAMSLGDITLNDSTAAEELDALLADDFQNTKDLASERDISLPDVPTSSPASKSKGGNSFLLPGS